MTIPVTKNSVQVLANEIKARLENVRSQLISTKISLNADNYAELLDIPRINKILQNRIVFIQGLGITAEIRTALDLILNATVNFADVVSFAEAVNSFSTSIESNASIFIMTINPTNKEIEFVTPISQGAKNTIVALIDSALTFVS